MCKYTYATFGGKKKSHVLNGKKKYDYFHVNTSLITVTCHCFPFTFFYFRIYLIFLIKYKMPNSVSFTESNVIANIYIKFIVLF